MPITYVSHCYSSKVYRYRCFFCTGRGRHDTTSVRSRIRRVPSPSQTKVQDKSCGKQEKSQISTREVQLSEEPVARAVGLIKDFRRARTISHVPLTSKRTPLFPLFFFTVTTTSAVNRLAKVLDAYDAGVANNSRSGGETYGAMSWACR